MKNVLLLKLFLFATLAQSQTIIQPISSGDYWTTDQFKTRLPELANNTTFPATISFPNGSFEMRSFTANRLTGANEIIFTTAATKNVTDYIIEWSRDLKTFQQATILHLKSADVEGGAARYVFQHSFNDNQLVYYRVGVLSACKVIAYTPSVQVLDEEHSTKIFPTLVKGSTFYIQTGSAYEKLQVINSANMPVYEKGISGQTGTITIGLPSLSTGIYFVRLLAVNKPQHVEKIMVE